MPEFIGQLITLAETLIVTGGYLGILMVMFAEAFFPPIPSEIIMPFSGYLASQGRLNPFGVWIAGAAGSLLGALALYHIGRSAGDALFRRLLRNYGRWCGIGEAQYDRVLALFRRRGEWIVLAGRVIPVVRTLISIPAGADRMPRLRFIVYTFIGASGWSGTLTLAGYWLGERWSEIGARLQPFSSWIGVGLAAAAALLLISFWVRQRRRTAEAHATARVESPR
jgi:membrane protein DedA with SNARE-associated domain